LEFGSVDKIVTFDSNYPKSKSPFPKNGVWDFDDNG
jgi:hypothetical protein